MSNLLVQRYGKSKQHQLRIVRCIVRNEHPDNDRFCADVSRWLGWPIETVINQKYNGDAFAVWEHRRYMSNRQGAPCIIELKKELRWQLEKDWHPDYQAFGFSFDEKDRADDFAGYNPDVRLLRILEEEKITKDLCAVLVHQAGLALPEMYRLGFRNNNCIGCVKATSPGYWAKVRHYFPDIFNRIAVLSRELGARLAVLRGVRVFIDEIPLDYDWRRYDRSYGFDCGLLCGPKRGNL